MNEASPPLNIAQLNERLVQVAAKMGIPVARARVMLCTLIVTQMLPDAVMVKGGMGVKIRLGERGTRATSDLDVSIRARGSEFAEAFSERLSAGWGSVPPSKGALKRDPDSPWRVAFTATVRAGNAHDPGLAHPEYVMHPYRVSLAFLGVAWGGLDVEVSDPEVDLVVSEPAELDDELVGFGASFGFGDLRPVKLVDVEYQIAQKIHAVTDPAYNRAHDLVDLQLLWKLGPDIVKVRELCVRTFEFRRQQPWPPLPMRQVGDWNLAYADAREETEVGGQTSVLLTVDEASEWLVTKIVEILEVMP